MKFSKLKQHGIRQIVPAVAFGAVSGVLTAVVITLYKVCAGWVIGLSAQGYAALRERLYLLPLVLAALLGAAFVFALIYRHHANLRGGGIPTSIGILRGIIRLHWLQNLFGTFALSLVTFLIGVPLGNEGPSVQMGTAVGRGVVRAAGKRHRAWDRYSMTGGACAGFATATGAPISGLLFAVEEAHGRIAPLIVVVAAVAVMCGHVVSELLSAVLPVHTALFPALDLQTLSVREAWLPLVIGVVLGTFAVLFLRYYEALSRLFKQTLRKLPPAFAIFAVFTATVLLGLCSGSFVSTGYDLMLSLFTETRALWMLLLILAVRSTLTLGANVNSLTGGLFIPTLTLGAVVSAVVYNLLHLCGLSADYYGVILVLGITACIAGMMKMPLTAIVFAVEALSGYGNVLYMIIAAAVAYAITEAFGAESINDTVLEQRKHRLHQGKTAVTVDTAVTVQAGSFAVGKQVRDVFWPHGLMVLSVTHADGGGGKELHAGDTLSVRYTTVDRAQTEEELFAIVGGQG